MKLFLCVILAVFNSANSFATPDFEKDAMMVQYISEGVSSAARDSKILESLGAGLKNTNDKLKLKDIISKFRVKQNRPTYIPFLNQLRVEIPGTSSFISFESNSKKAHSILVNGHIEIVYDPDNIWNSIADSSRKTTWFNLILPQANAGDGTKPNNTDLVSTAIFLMSASDGISREVVATYFKSKESTPFSKAGELRAVCVGEDKAKTFNTNHKLQIEDVGDGYKISSQGAKAFFKIVPVSNSLSSEVLSKCVDVTNYRQLPRHEQSKFLSVERGGGIYYLKD